MMADPRPNDADTAPGDAEGVCLFSNVAADFRRHWIPAFAGMTMYPRVVHFGNAQ
jgi:hypothetical protein